MNRGFCRLIIKTTMGRKDILRLTRTDDHETRQQRRASHKLTAIQKVWKIFTKLLTVTLF